MQQDAITFLNCLRRALSLIENDYIRISVANQKERIARERIFCYELYHQMRLACGEIHFPYVIGGELDKRGHPLIRGNVIPDFVVHQPGMMERNLSVIEVKPITGTASSFRDDMIKLLRFVDEYQYQSAIFLLFGSDTTTDGINAIKKLLQEMQSELAGKDIYVLWKPSAEENIVELRNPL